MTTAFISVSSNFGDRREMLKEASERISFANKVLGISNVYETFRRHQNGLAFLTCCIQIQTDMQSTQLAKFLKETEEQLGGTKSSEMLDQRTIDLDLISFGSEIVRMPQMTLPHPEAHSQAFVMIPLAEIDPQWVHPVLGKTAEILAQQAFWPGWGSFFANGKSLLDF